MRYFIVFYVTKHLMGESRGDMSFSTDNYPSAMALTKIIKEKHGCIAVVFTNIIELNKRDFDCWGATVEGEPERGKKESFNVPVQIESM